MKTTIQNPALLWRKRLTNGFYPEGLQPGTYPEEVWLDISKKMYAKNKLEVRNSKLLATNSDICNMELFLSAVYLFTFGKLEVAIDIIRYRPDKHSRYYGFLQVIIDMIPFPVHMQNLSNPAFLETWLNINANKLSWHEASGVFVANAGSELE